MPSTVSIYREWINNKALYSTGNYIQSAVINGNRKEYEMHIYIYTYIHKYIYINIYIYTYLYTYIREEKGTTEDKMVGWYH